MNNFKENFAGTDIIDRWSKSPTPVPKSLKGHHRPFGYWNGILYVGPRGKSLTSIVTSSGIKGHTDGWEVPGKIYDQHKVIYFTRPPKRMTSFIRELEQIVSVYKPIIITPDWVVKVKDIGTFKLKDYTKRTEQQPNIRYSTDEGTIKLKDLLLETTYFSTDQTIKKHVDPPIDSDKKAPIPSAATYLTDSIKAYSKGDMRPAQIKKEIMKYKLLGGSLEGLFHVVRQSLEPSLQKNTMRELQNYYLEGQKFSRSGWRRNDYRQ